MRTVPTLPPSDARREPKPPKAKGVPVYSAERRSEKERRENPTPFALMSHADRALNRNLAAPSA